MWLVQVRRVWVAVQAEDWLSWVVEDKKRCRIVSDVRCVMCDSGLGENVAHFLLGCGEFEKDQLMLLDDVCRIVGSRELVGRILESGRGRKGGIAFLKRGKGYI